MTDAEAEVREFVQARAKKFGAYVAIEKRNDLDSLNLGPFFLRCSVTGKDIWVYGLPIEGVVDALNCLERELSGEDAETAWCDFGSRR